MSAPRKPRKTSQRSTLRGNGTVVQKLDCARCGAPIQVVVKATGRGGVSIERVTRALELAGLAARTIERVIREL